MIEYSKKVFARNCEVRRIGSEEARSFLGANHRLGFTKCRHFYGLFLSRRDRCGLPVGTLVAVSGFSAPRVWQKTDGTVRSCEWVRYASLERIGVVGGMSKMLKAFVEDVGPDDVMTYADASWSDGDVYRLLGFEQEETKVFLDGSRSLKFRLRLMRRQGLRAADGQQKGSRDHGPNHPHSERR